jgi:tRNA(Ile)-lysidine synthase
VLSPFPVLNGEHIIKNPGTTVIPGWRIQVNIIDSIDSISDDNSFTAYFDYSRTGDKLVVRSRKRGDRFQPLGMKDQKKLSQFMLDAKIPTHWRDNVPIIASPDGIVWVMGYRMDERVKVTEKTKKVLYLEFQRI